jgi:glycosyltransferase involved in cell wall biosynthesis
MPRYSIIIAALNEEGPIGPLLAALGKMFGDEAELIVVDDGSTDGTSEAARRGGAGVIRNDRNMGKGAALLRGIEAATGEIALFLDADGQDPPEDAPALLEPLNRGYDFIIGSKFIGVRRPGSISAINSLGNRFMSAVINTLFGVSFTDTQSGFKAIRMSGLKTLRLSASEYDIESEMLLQAVKKGLKITEVPVARDRRRAGQSGFRRIRHGCKILFMILRQRATP